MCFNATASLVSLIAGILVAVAVGIVALQKQYVSLALLAFGWIWVIAMQWWEFMVWRQWQTEVASRMAYVFNMMQIPVLFLLFSLVPNLPPAPRMVASVIVAAYLCIMLYPLPSEEIEVRHGHLDYSWWKSRVRIIAYFVGLISIFLLLVRPLAWSVACILSLMILCVLSRLLYHSENVASLWCFFAVFFPLWALLLRWYL
jgi:hypothetical protein